MKDKKYCKVIDDCHYTGEYRGVHKKIPMAFHNGSNYDYHFTIKELAKGFKNILLA